ncbi:MAG TPA: RHS repeat-associated core domain-containing protein [Candidatus Angelobacter sp.]
MPDSQTFVVMGGSSLYAGGAVPVFDVSYVPDQSAEMGPCTQCQAQAGAPINVITGNTWIQQQDYALPGLGGGIELTRTWNSTWSNNRPPKQVGMFGDGWTSSYEESLSQSASGLKYWSGAGTAWIFSFNSSTGTYTLSSPSDARGTLTFDSTLNQYTVTLKDGTKRIFDSGGRLLKLLDRNANTTSLVYDSSGRLSTVTDAAGRTLSFAYADPSNVNQVTTVSDAVGTIATYTYAPNGVLSSVIYADGSGFNFTSDASNLITNVTDPGGKTIESHSYDSLRRGLSSAEANNVRSVSISYTGAGTSQLTDTFGNVTSIGSQAINRKHYISSTSGPGCATCGAVPGDSYTYDSQGNMASATDALGRVTNYTYDSNGNVASVSRTVNGLTVSSSYTYNSFGEVLTTTDPLGHVTTNIYDANGNLLTATTPSPGGKTAGSKTSFAYDTKGELTQITDPLGHVIKLAYTPAGLVSSITDPLLHVTAFTYDARGNRISQTDALNNKTTFQYDARNRLTKVIKPDLTTISYAYDSRGRRTSVTDENNKVTQYVYDDADRLISVTDANTGVTQYAYDSENNLTSITDALLHTTSLGYDSQRRLIQTTFPSTKTEIYGYDAIGNQISKTDRKAQIINYAYDELTRLTKKTYPDASTVAFTYDAASRLTNAQDPTGTYTFTYDNMDRLTNSSTVYASLPAKTFSVSQAYDAGSNRTSLTDSNNGSISYTYDVLNRLTTLKDFNRNSFTFGYDALGRPTTMGRPNAVNSTYQYDAVSNLLSVLHQKGTATVDGGAYSYDAAGNRTTKTNKLNNATSNYAYDSLYQLTGVTQGSSTTEAYTYDAGANRLSSAAIPSYSYNASNELLNGPASYTYDDNGNVLTKTDSTGTTSYTWDFENRLASVRLPSGSATIFKYDPFGRRVQKGSSIYLYDRSHLIQESDSAGNLVSRYIHAPGPDSPVAAYRGSASEFYQADGLGSITSLTNTSGVVNQTYVYDSFGNTSSTTGTFVQPFRYTGREFDSETGLLYYRARYYDPQSGRFLNEDPIRFDAGINFYTYVDNNPITWIDPKGKQKDSVTASLENAIRNGNSAEIQNILDAAKDVLSDEAKELGKQWIKTLRSRCGDLIRGSLKRSPSYHSELENEVYEDLLKDGSQEAKQMVKLIKQSVRLMEKVGGK